MRLCVLHNLYFYNTYDGRNHEMLLMPGEYQAYKKKKLSAMAGPTVLN